MESRNPFANGLLSIFRRVICKEFFHAVVLPFNKEVTLPFRYNKGNNNTEVYGNAITLKLVTFVGNTFGSTVCMPTPKPTLIFRLDLEVIQVLSKLVPGFL